MEGGPRRGRLATLLSHACSTRRPVWDGRMLRDEPMPIPATASRLGTDAAPPSHNDGWRSDVRRALAKYSDSHRGEQCDPFGKVSACDSPSSTVGGLQLESADRALRSLNLAGVTYGR